MSKRNGQKSVNKRKKRKTIFLISFFLVAIGLVIGLSLTVFFPVKNIVIEGESDYFAEDIAAASGISEEDNLFLLNEESVLSIIQHTLPFVKDVTIKRKLPNTAVLKVTDVDTYLIFEKDGAQLYTDDNFRIVPGEVKEEKFKLMVYCNWEKDSSANNVVLTNKEDIEIIEKIISSSKESGINVKLVNLQNGEDIRLLVDNRFEVLMGNSYDFSGKFAQLVAMVNTIDNEKTGRINLADWNIDNTKGYFVEADVSTIS